MRPTSVLLLIFTGNVASDGIESESYYSDETGLEETTRRPAAAIVVVQGTARPGSSSPTPTSTSTAVVDLSSPPTLIPATKDEEDDLLQYFDKKGKLIYCNVPVKNTLP